VALDINLLRILKSREEFMRMRPRIPKGAVGSQTEALIADFGKYFERLPEHQSIDIPTFLTMFKTWHPKLEEETVAAYEKIIGQVSTDIEPGSRDGIMQSILELRLGKDLLELVTAFEDGDIENIHARLEDISEQFKKDANIKSLDFLRDDIGDLLQSEIDDSGMRWRLGCLNASMRGLRGGDFGIVAGRPDKGKTTFLASEISCMAQQLPSGRPVVWLNNEGPGNRITPRLYQAALGMTMSELIAMHGTGRLNEEYNAMMGMPWRIRVFDIHGLDTYAVERIIEQNNPGLVVYDMIDNVRGFGDAARTDLMLEHMYQWARELAVKYDFAGIATSQISQDGDGMQYPTLPMLKDSKTGKQGACDFQIMIGASNDPNLGSMRYIGAPKNKLRREGARPDPRSVVSYKPEIARYEDTPVSTEDIANGQVHQTETPE